MSAKVQERCTWVFFFFYEICNFGAGLNYPSKAAGFVSWGLFSGFFGGFWVCVWGFFCLFGVLCLFSFCLFGFFVSQFVLLCFLCM